jgi:hypothetical protein
MLSIRTVREADDLFVQHMKTALGGGVLLIAGIVLGMALMQRQVPRDARDTISYCFNTAWRMDFHREAFKKYSCDPALLEKSTAKSLRCGGCQVAAENCTMKCS